MRTHDTWVFVLLVLSGEGGNDPGPPGAFQLSFSTSLLEDLGTDGKFFISEPRKWEKGQTPLGSCEALVFELPEALLQQVIPPLPQAVPCVFPCRLREAGSENWNDPKKSHPTGGFLVSFKGIPKRLIPQTRKVIPY